MSKWLDRAALLGAGGALAGIAFVSWLYLLYARPMGDDHWLAVQGREIGPVAYANSVWSEKSGRWTGHALIAFALSHEPLTRSYPLLLGALAGIQVAATYALFRALLRETVPRRTLLAWAIAFEALLWAGRVAPGETMYWFSGAVPYELSLSCSLLLVAGLIAGRGPAWKAAFVLLPPFVAGLHELVGMVLSVVLLAGAGTAWRRRMPSRSRWLWSAAASLAGCALSLAAPGNAVRAAQPPEAGDVLFTLRTALADSLLYARQWILEPKLLSASIFLWLSPAFRAPRPRWLDSGARWLPTVGSTAVVSLAILLTGMRWALGNIRTPRLIAVDYSVFFLAWFLVLFLVTRSSRGLPRSETVRALGRVAAAAVLAYSLFATGNGGSARSDISSGRLAAWDDYMETRDRTLRDAAARGVRRLVLEPPPAFPWVFERWLDITTDSKNGYNRFLARYHGLRSVAVAVPRDSGGALPRGR